MEELRKLPAVGALLARPELTALAEAHGAGLIRHAVRHLVAEARLAIQAGAVAPASDVLAAEAVQRVRRLVVPALRRAVNASGVLLHTGLGRAPLGESATAALAVAAGATPVQASLSTGDRSQREERVERLLIDLTGCEAATVVNNNAAATALMLSALAGGREVVISRGQLVEIGGAFRMPDVMRLSGCRMVEVGCTNRTHLRDYEAAITADTGALIHVHTSNYRVRGFAGSPGIAELAPLAHAKGLLALDDIGSGALVPLSAYGLADEPLVADSIRAGADAACFSGDKLICGPQAGIIVGRSAAIARIRKHPLARMLRVCKLTLAALEATLAEFVAGRHESLPFYAALRQSPADVRAQADDLASRLAALPGVQATVVPAVAYVGSGSAPDEGVPSSAVRIRVAGVSTDDLARRLRQGEPAVFVRLEDGAALADCRSLRPGEAELICTAVARIAGVAG
jgi:L-seryl-tRNA(Ser) seleniumtransferase